MPFRRKYKRNNKNFKRMVNKLTKSFVKSSITRNQNFKQFDKRETLQLSPLSNGTDYDRSFYIRELSPSIDITTNPSMAQYRIKSAHININTNASCRVIFLQYKRSSFIIDDNSTPAKQWMIDNVLSDTYVSALDPTPTEVATDPIDAYNGGGTLKILKDFYINVPTYSDANATGGVLSNRPQHYVQRRIRLNKLLNVKAGSQEAGDYVNKLYMLVIDNQAIRNATQNASTWFFEYNAQVIHNCINTT